MASQTEKEVSSWNDFVAEIESFSDQYRITEQNTPGGTYRRSNSILFRGHTDSSWELKTTLERRLNKDQCALFEYLKYAYKYAHEIESYMGVKWGCNMESLENESHHQTDLMPYFEPYDYLVYLRHHGFPSPLLDWTFSPYIAAYFAMRDVGTSEKAAVYCYVERPHGSKGWSGSKPRIYYMGPNVTTTKRHFVQQAAYTIAARWDSQDESYTIHSHKDVFKDPIQGQDIAYKIIIPRSLRTEFLRRLNEFNITDFSLYQSEDSLVKSIEMKVFDCSK